MKLLSPASSESLAEDELPLRPPVPDSGSCHLSRNRGRSSRMHVSLPAPDAATCVCRGPVDVTACWRLSPRWPACLARHVPLARALPVISVARTCPHREPLDRGSVKWSASCVQKQVNTFHFWVIYLS